MKHQTKHDRRDEREGMYKKSGKYRQTSHDKKDERNAAAHEMRHDKREGRLEHHTNRRDANHRKYHDYLPHRLH